MTEVQSADWRDGMITGLSLGVTLVDEWDLRGRDLQRTLVCRFNATTPKAYHAYVTTYLHQGDTYGVSPKMLSFWQWRYLAADLAEIVQVTELLGCEPGIQEEEARAALLLDAATPSTAPFQALCARGLTVDPATDLATDLDPDFHDGYVDGINLCWQLIHDGGFDGDDFCLQVEFYLDDLWPDDYKLYLDRHDHLHHCPPLTYTAWCQLAHDLAAEIERCTAAGAPLSRKRVDLSRRLLCRPDDLAPTLAWTLPARLEAELS